MPAASLTRCKGIVAPSWICLPVPILSYLDPARNPTSTRISFMCCCNQAQSRTDRALGRSVHSKLASVRALHRIGTLHLVYNLAGSLPEPCGLYTLHAAAVAAAAAALTSVSPGQRQACNQHHASILFCVCVHLWLHPGSCVCISAAMCFVLTPSVASCPCCHCLMQLAVFLSAI